MTEERLPLRIVWDGHLRSEWDRLADAAPDCPFEQSWIYGEAYARHDGEAVRRGIAFDGEAPLALVQAFTRRFGGLVTLVQILRGPVLLASDAAPDAVAALYRRIKTEVRRPGREILFWTPELPAGEEAVAAMRACGLRRVVTGHASARIDLTAEEPSLRAALHGKWRNALARAEAAALRVESSGGGTLAWLIERYGTLRSRRSFGGPSTELLVRALAHARPADVVALRAFSGNEAVAGALFLRHGRCASYLIGWTADEGRPLNAGALLLWQGMIALKERGGATLDLGGIDTRRAPGIARFKMGTGGAPYVLAGTFV
jgi:hypothetical protein